MGDPSRLYFRLRSPAMQCLLTGIGRPAGQKWLHAVAASGNLTGLRSREKRRRVYRSQPHCHTHGSENWQACSLAAHSHSSMGLPMCLHAKSNFGSVLSDCLLMQEVTRQFTNTMAISSKLGNIKGGVLIQSLWKCWSFMENLGCRPFLPFLAAEASVQTPFRTL